ncbi:MAG TPA: glycosyltransferase family 4 protein [Caldisericia bacterium]|nr:glycosyltransferase family 4 protein [Caldisericia bacterium]HPF48337.1 glycosyltransferase family 4 protein [Caldisericia bacterium]HPI83484.1 glycosyltransferase family 4 protein [Caldisericia bacterium]HPQ92790.1 glycosyltransferase family 4 protein [Caldisericia bacterium]HRV74112.1 glycosyltransferase family 4 protein [Caldisericia bacterium]
MARKIKLAQVICGTDVAGAKGYTIDLTLRADKDLFEVYHIHPLEGMTTKEARDAGIEPFVVKQNPWEIAKLIRELNLDLIHTHGVRANFTGRVASRLTKIPNICTMHSDSRLDYDSKLKERAVWFADNVLNKWADGFIGVSQDMSEKLAKRGIPEDKIHTVYNGIDLEKVVARKSSIESKRELGIPENLRLIGTVGRLVEVKGQDDIIKALPYILAKVPDAAAIIIGDGRCYEPLRKLAEDLRVTDRVFLPGRITPPFDIMAACDVGVFPSLAEAIGLGLLEFMALGVPVVATNVCGIPEVITNDSIGLMVPPSSPKRLAEAIIRVMTDVGLTNTLIKTARKRVEESFTTKTMLDGTQKIWQKYARSRD